MALENCTLPGSPREGSVATATGAPATGEPAGVKNEDRIQTIAVEGSV